jgi:hypothetical protein
MSSTSGAVGEADSARVAFQCVWVAENWEPGLPFWEQLPKR